MVLKNQNKLDNIENKLKKLLENNPKNSSALNSLGIVSFIFNINSFCLSYFPEIILYEKVKVSIKITKPTK